MRLFLLPALALLAAPALAQTGEAPPTDEREIVIERTGPPGGAPMIRRMIIVNGDTTLDERRGDVNAFRFRGDGPLHWRGDVYGEGPKVLLREGVGPDGERLRGAARGRGNVFHIRERALDGDGEDVVRLRGPGADDTVFFRGEPGPGFMSEFLAGPMQGGVSAETRERMHALEREARQVARTARAAEGADRRDAERRLDAVLGDLFEVRGQARREEAAHLRTQAAEMMEHADEVEEALAEREARRRALIEARRAELLGAPASDW